MQPKNGKKVTVVIELLARFDEASNINWSKKMQDAGIHVIFGVEGLKIHSKLLHIGTRHGDIACISTGNFHEGNARMYTDYTIMTAHRPIVREVNAVFDFIEKPYTPVDFKELLVSPNDMRKRFIALINKEIKNKEQGKEAYILAKVNHITDRALVEKLYEASTAGVQVELVVRGNCSLVTGRSGYQREYTHQWYYRPLSRTFAHFHLRQWWRRKILTLVLPTGCLATWIIVLRWRHRSMIKKSRQI